MSFPITCTACHKTFTVSDEIYEKKVAGRVVTIKCKSCGHGIRVDGSKGAAGAVASSPPATAVDPVAPSEPLWAVDYPDGQDREFTTREVLAELERGVVTGQTLVWRDGMAEWLELAQVAELAPELAKVEAKKKAEAEAKAKAEAEAEAKAKLEATKAKAEAAAKTRADAAAKAKAAPAAMHQPRAPMPTVSGLGASGGANTAKAKAPAGTSPGLKPRAPLGSAPRSPLGSSPELKSKESAVSASQEITPRVPAVHVPAAAIPPAPAAIPAAAPSPAPIIAAPAPAVTSVPAPALRPVPLESQTPPLPASVAKVVSKPPQVPAALPSFPMSTTPAPTFGNLPAVVADHASVEWPETKKKTRIAIFGVVAAALALGGVVFALSRKDELPPPTPISALPSPPGAPTTAPTPATTPTVTSTNRPGDETASGSDPVIATPGAGFAELFAAGARKAESKGATVAPSARFDPASTKAPLAQAATDAQACKQSGGPSGKVTVVVTFDPNGKAAGATITDAPFAGTPTGSCIVAAMKRAAIPPFSGLPGTVSKTFTLL